jgi:hypothetical protein
VAFLVAEHLNVSSGLAGEHIILKIGNGTPLHAKLLSENLSTSMHNSITNKPNANNINQHGRYQLVEEPWIHESIVASKKPVARVKDKKGKKKFVNNKHDSSRASEYMPQEDQPVEEPWLLESMVEANETIVHADGKIEAKDIIRKSQLLVNLHQELYLLTPLSALCRELQY